ncbi:MAG TPA: hypothetical protein DCZ92_10100 [Elusimicrobia bacterium]|nr:MAG: hypothetical protein A2016_07425 [Elusimicrobia bacterium GWF2_62_30]HBA61151.1 hypothetical protein [Elusimicrobiota bacterium]
MAKPVLLRAVIILQALLLAAVCAGAQEQNKVIVKDFKWAVYSTPHFDVHYYPDSEPWLAYAGKVLEDAYSRQSAELNPALTKRIPFFLYASQNDMQQNNVADVSDGVGGLTEAFKDRFMVWSDGSRGWLKNVIEHEFAHEVQFSLLVDGFWKSARILKTYIYPSWMMEGIAEYETGGEDYAVEKMYARDAVLGGGLPRLSRLTQFGHLKPHQVTLAYKTGGQVIRFLAQQYGSDKPRKLLEIFRNKYESTSVLLPLIGTDLEEFDRKFREYSSLKYGAEAASERLQEPGVYGVQITSGASGIPEFNMSPAVSPDGKSLAYLSTRAGHPSEVRIRDLATGAEKKLEAFSAGAENIPYGRFTKPLRSLSWSPDGASLVFAGQKNHREYLFLYSVPSGRVTRAGMEGLAEVRQPVFSPDGKKVAFIGMGGSFNDIYEVAAERLAHGGAVGRDELARLTDSRQDEASPAYAPDGSGLAYSCETERGGALTRELCFLPAGGTPRSLLRLDGAVYDPVFSPDGKTLYFISDSGDNFELYSFDRVSGNVSRLTRSLGGMFTPLAAGDRLYFSAFRRGEMHLYAAPAALPAAGTVAARGTGEEGGAPAAEVSSGTFRPYRFKASTDLFYPAFMFSSPGGLLWTNYWQASDMLGNHNLALYLYYNSGYGYMNYQVNYSYARWRMPLLLQTAGLFGREFISSSGYDYNKRYARHAVGTAWPFDRYNRVEAYAVVKDESNDYREISYRERYDTRALQTKYVRDTVNGLYLIANRGSRTELSWLTAIDTAGGNMKYDVFYLNYMKYLPLSKRSTVVDRFTAGRSVGRDRRIFGFGGLGGVRGLQSYADEFEKPGVFMNNVELRVPLASMDYYFGYIFPDLYFKALYGRLFLDSGYGWDGAAELRGFRAADVSNTAGVGIDLHTFVLQTFQLVISFDYAVRASDGGKIFYFYLGPMF